MYNILIIIKGTFFVLLVYITSYLIEKIFLLKLLIDGFVSKKKSINIAQGAAGFNSIFIFFLTNLIVLLVDLSNYNETPESYNFAIWLLIMFFLTIIFGILFFKYTGKDPNIKDDDYI